MRLPDAAAHNCSLLPSPIANASTQRGHCRPAQGASGGKLMCPIGQATLGILPRPARGTHLQYLGASCPHG